MVKILPLGSERQGVIGIGHLQFTRPEAGNRADRDAWPPPPEHLRMQMTSLCLQHKQPWALKLAAVLTGGGHRLLSLCGARHSWPDPCNGI